MNVSSIETIVVLGIVTLAVIAVVLALRHSARVRTLLVAAQAAEHKARVAQRELHDAHQTFTSFMANLPYPAFIHDERGELVFVNQAGTMTSGWRDPPAPAGGDGAPAANAPNDHHMHYFSIRFPLPLEGKTWLGGIAIDVSERFRAQQALLERTAEFETLFDNVPAPLWLARDPTGRELVCNPAAARLLGLPQATRSFDAFAPTMSVRFLQNGQAMTTKALPLHVCMAERRVVQGADLEVVHPDGTHSHLRTVAAPLFDTAGLVRGGVAAALDISQLKTYEAQLEQAVQRRDEFLAVLAHELRNPLAPIRNSVQILQRVPDDVDRVRRGIATIERQTSLLVRLIDDLLDVARVSQGLVELELSPRTVEALVAGAVATATSNDAGSVRKIAVEHEDAAATVLVDALRAEQILVNLLANAMKYSAADAGVTIRSRVDGDFAKIDVIDKGQGIASEELPGIFTMFAPRRSPENFRIGGLGVGLALARQLAEQLGGGIEAASEGPGKGAAFTVSFPLARSTLRPAGRRQGSGHPRTIE